MTYQQNKKSALWKNTAFQYFRQNSNNLQKLNKLESLQNCLTKSIAEYKRNCYSGTADKLLNTQKSSKPYLSLLVKNIPEQQNDTSYSPYFSQ